MEEVWYPARYNGAVVDFLEISDKFNLRNAYDKRPYNWNNERAGYIRAIINCWNGKNNLKMFIKHRMVAETFIPNPENKPQVNHIDGNKKNNSIENLEWVTNKENSEHAWRTGLCKPHHTKHCKYFKKFWLRKFTESQVKKIRKEFIPYDRRFGCLALARKYSVSDSTMRAILNNEIYREI